MDGKKPDFDHILSNLKGKKRRNRYKNLVRKLKCNKHLQEEQKLQNTTCDEEDNNQTATASLPPDENNTQEHDVVGDKNQHQRIITLYLPRMSVFNLNPQIGN